MNKKVVPDIAQPGPGFATVTETARFLHLSKSMIHREVNCGNIPSTRYGRAVRIPWSWLRAQAQAMEAR
jgi:excisionase family DNA binding protein